MNKMMKAGIATGVGVVLLLGGAGSLALWNDSANVGAARTISTGVLTVDAVGSWSDETLAKWVPGDKVTYTADVDIVAIGDNLASELSIDLSSLTGAAALKDALAVKMTVSGVTGGTLVETGVGTNIYTVKPTVGGNGEMTAKVAVEVELPTSVVEKTAQNGSVSLDDLAFQLKQVRA